MIIDYEFIDNALTIKQIKACKNESLGPFSLVLMGNKYGSLKLSEKIQKEKFHLIESEFKRNLENGGFDLLKKFYKLDQNEEPEVYCLSYKDV